MNGWKVSIRGRLIDYIPSFEQADPTYKGLVALTPHPVNIAGPDGTPLLILAPAKNPPRIRQKVTDNPVRTVSGVPVYAQTMGELEGMPAPRPGVTYVGGIMLLAHLQNRGDFVAIDSQRGVFRPAPGEMWISRFLSGPHQTEVQPQSDIETQSQDKSNTQPQFDFEVLRGKRGWSLVLLIPRNMKWDIDSRDIAAARDYAWKKGPRGWQLTPAQGSFAVWLQGNLSASGALASVADTAHSGWAIYNMAPGQALRVSGYKGRSRYVLSCDPYFWGSEEEAIARGIDAGAGK